MSLLDIKRELPELTREELREIYLLAGHLLEVPEVIVHEAHPLLKPVLNKLEARLGIGVAFPYRNSCASKLLTALTNAEVFQGEGTTADRAFQMSSAVDAIFRGIEKDGRVLNWRTLMLYCDRIGDVLEQQFPHYRLTNVFKLAAQRQASMRG